MTDTCPGACVNRQRKYPGQRCTHKQAHQPDLSRRSKHRFQEAFTLRHMLQDQTVTAADLVGEPAPQGGMSAIGNLFTRGPGAEQRRQALPLGFRMSRLGARLGHTLCSWDHGLHSNAGQPVGKGV